jgi:predicted nucleic-acid-binding Zn-ribbon protein
MKNANCPECGGGDLYTREQSTLLRDVPVARFNVVICADCGLTRFFARRTDLPALKAADWVRAADRVSPLGLDRT